MTHERRSEDEGPGTSAARRGRSAGGRLDLPGNFHYLIGSEGQLKPTWDSYQAAPPGDPESSHSASIWMIDAEGRIRTKFPAAAPVPPADIAHDFRVLLDETDAQPAASGPNASGS